MVIAKDLKPNIEDCRGGLVVRVSALWAEGHGFDLGPQ